MGTAAFMKMHLGELGGRNTSLLAEGGCKFNFDL